MKYLDRQKTREDSCQIFTFPEGTFIFRYEAKRGQYTGDKVKTRRLRQAERQRHKDAILAHEGWPA